MAWDVVCRGPLKTHRTYNRVLVILAVGSRRHLFDPQVYAYPPLGWVCLVQQVCESGHCIARERTMGEEKEGERKHIKPRTRRLLSVLSPCPLCPHLNRMSIGGV